MAMAIWSQSPRIGAVHLTVLGFQDSLLHAYPIDTGCIFGVRFDPCQNTREILWNFSIYSLTRWLALAIWSVSDGRKVSNVHLVVMSVNRGVFNQDHESWNVVNVENKSVLRRAL